MEKLIPSAHGSRLQDKHFAAGSSRERRAWLTVLTVSVAALRLRVVQAEGDSELARAFDLLRLELMARARALETQPLVVAPLN